MCFGAQFTLVAGGSILGTAGTSVNAQCVVQPAHGLMLCFEIEKLSLFFFSKKKNDRWQVGIEFLMLIKIKLVF